MSIAKETRNVGAEEPTLFDSHARLVPEGLQTAYYRVLAHTHTLSPDDEMLRILEAMGVLALLTRQTPKDIADERERFQEMLDLHRQFSEDTRQKTLSYVHQLESRLAELPGEIEAGLDPQQIAKLLGESLRQHFVKSEMPETVRGLQTATASMTDAHRDLTTALHALSDSHGGIVAQIESANSRLTYSLESRAKAVDDLLRELKNDVQQIWLPLVAGATLLIGLIAGVNLQSWRDSRPTYVATRPPSITQTEPIHRVEDSDGAIQASRKTHTHNRQKTNDRTR